MIITLKKDAPKQEVDKLIHSFEEKGLSVTMINGDNYNALVWSVIPVSLMKS